MSGEEANIEQLKKRKENVDVSLRSWPTRPGRKRQQILDLPLTGGKKYNSSCIPNEIKHEIKLGNDLWFLATFVNDIESQPFFGKALNVYLNLVNFLYHKDSPASLIVI